MSEPTPPTNVRLIGHDDIEYPVEVYYRGVDEVGNHIWVATVTWHGLPKGLLCDRLPAHTAISVDCVP